MSLPYLWKLSSVQTKVLMRKLIFLKHSAGLEMTSVHICLELWRQGVSTESNLSRSAGTLRKTWQQASRAPTILQQASKVDAKELKGTFIVKDWNQTLQQALSHQSSKMVAKVAEVTSCMDEDLECDLRQRTESWHCSLRSLSLPLAANYVHIVT